MRTQNKDANRVEPAPRNRRAGGTITSLRTPRKRSGDQHANLRRSYQAFLRKLAFGDSASSPYQAWPVRPYAASI